MGRLGTASITANLATGPNSPRTAVIAFTPTAADRRTAPCFGARYTGENRYTGATASVLCSAVGPAPTNLQATVSPSNTYTRGETQTLSVTLAWPDSVGIVGRVVCVASAGRTIASITLTPDPTGRGIATGSTSLKLPFRAGELTFTYPQSGDLGSTNLLLPTTMNPVSTTMLVSVPTPATNPFVIRHTLQLNTGGMPLPSGVSLGGSVQIFDGQELLATQTIGPLQISDGSSNTINLTESTSVSGTLNNVIRPLGQRSIRVRFVGSSQRPKARW